MINLHDFEIVAIDINKQHKAFTLKAVSPDQKVYSILFEGVEKLIATNVTLQNIVLDSMIFEEYADNEYFKYCKLQLDLPENWFGYKEKFVFYIEPTSGLELCCVFKSCCVSQESSNSSANASPAT